MSLYNPGGRQDYSAPVKWEPPPPRPPRPASSWGAPLVILCLVAVIGWLLWDKVAHHPPASTRATSNQTASIDEASAQTEPEDYSPPTDEPSSTSEPPADNAGTPDFDFHLDPSEPGSFYCSRELKVTATVEGLTGYSIEWTIEPDAPELHLVKLDTITHSVMLSATASFGSGNPLRVDLYDRPGLEGKLLYSQWLDVGAREPLEVDLPGSARMSADPWQSTVIAPTVDWEGDTVFSRTSSSPPDGMSFEWRWEEGELAGTDPTFTIPSDSYQSQRLILTVFYEGFSAEDRMQIN